MTKLKLQPEPTFRGTVKIPVPGAEAQEVTFTFRHRNREELKALTDSMAKGDRTDVDQILAMATAWDLTDEFNAENVGVLVSNFYAAPRAIFYAYIEELTQAKEKN